MKNTLITICLLLLVPPICAYGAELLVPGQYPTIQAAVNAAAEGDSVIIAPGIYIGPGNHDIVVNKNITIRSENGPETCIIDCNGTSGEPHIGFDIDAGTLAGLTITRSYSTLPEGAIFCNNGNAKLINCILTNNLGTQGGAVSCRNGFVEIKNCSLINNGIPVPLVGPIGFGGAIYCFNGSVFIANSTVSGNLSTAGGGIYCTQNSSVTVKNCVISDNNAVERPPLLMGGGGIYCEQGNLTVIRSQISGNFASKGAGISCIAPTFFLISDCNIHDNVAEGPYGGPSMGGGIYYKNANTPSPASGKPFAILNSSITDNIIRGTDSKGGGIYLETPLSDNPPKIADIMLDRCVIARNSTELLPHTGPNYGGGLFSTTDILLLETQITENSAIYGGGICNFRRNINLTRCRISGNFAQFDGSAILSNLGEVAVENCVISGNRSFENGAVLDGGIHLILKMSNCTIVGNTPPVFSYSIRPMSFMINPSSLITNSIIYFNSPAPKYYGKLPLGYPNNFTYNDIQGGFGGTGNIDADPCFVIPGYWDTNDLWIDGDYRLMTDSPCIDSGRVIFLMDNKDLAGNPRIAGNSIDIGAYEYQNTTPVANAGEDVNVFAWIDGNSIVTLNGSASYDPDGDELTYFWTWSIDGNTYSTNGVNPTIELPVGQHILSLIVNDGWEDSEPNEVTITVVEPIEGSLWVTPRIINGRGRHQKIMAMLRLPESINRQEIDANYTMLLYPGKIEANWQHISQHSRRGVVIFACFNGSALMDAAGSSGPIQLDVVGRLKTGQYFFGRDTVRIIDHYPNHKP